ncbi:hypothetical protein ACFVUW_11775 [Streptomyces xiamenensis]|uniref:hypothetical protein n=1 Tax=Streptomyces xiamenensis TaxID=408015 RepID=UPI0036E62776
MTTLLTYQPPTYAAADGQTHPVIILATNQGKSPVVVSQVVFAVPHGPGEGCLTDEQPQEAAPYATGSNNWDATPSLSSDGTQLILTFSIDGGLKIAAQGTIEFGFNAKVTTSGPPVAITIDETAEGNNNSGAIQLPTLPPQVTISNLRAKPFTVRAGADPVYLQWATSSPPASHTDFAYTLEYTTPTGTTNANPAPAHNSTLWPQAETSTCRLTRDTTFHLTATLSSDAAKQPITVHLYAFAHVTHPDLTAGKLSAAQTVTLLQHPHNHAGYLRGYTPWNNDERMGTVDEIFQADTDGLLLISGRVAANMGQDTYLTVVATPEDALETVLTIGYLDNTAFDDDMLLPVSAGRKVALTAHVTSAGQPADNIAYVLSCHWSPLGTGALTPTP